MEGDPRRPQLVVSVPNPSSSVQGSMRLQQTREWERMRSLEGMFFPGGGAGPRESSGDDGWGTKTSKSTVSRSTSRAPKTPGGGRRPQQLPRLAYRQGELSHGLETHTGKSRFMRLPSFSPGPDPAAPDVSFRQDSRIYRPPPLSSPASPASPPPGTPGVVPGLEGAASPRCQLLTRAPGFYPPGHRDSAEGGEEQQKGLYTRVYPNATPSSRREAIALDEWLERQLRAISEEEESLNDTLWDQVMAGGRVPGQAPPEEAAPGAEGSQPELGQQHATLRALSTGSAELVRQVAVHCLERGQLLAKVWNTAVAEYDSLLHAQTTRAEAAEARAEAAEAKLAEAERRLASGDVDARREMGAHLEELERQVAELTEREDRVREVLAQIEAYIEKTVSGSRWRKAGLSSAVANSPSSKGIGFVTREAENIIKEEEKKTAGVDYMAQDLLKNVFKLQKTSMETGALMAAKAANERFKSESAIARSQQSAMYNSLMKEMEQNIEAESAKAAKIASRINDGMSPEVGAALAKLEGLNPMEQAAELMKMDASTRNSVLNSMASRDPNAAAELLASITDPSERAKAMAAMDAQAAAAAMAKMDPSVAAETLRNMDKKQKRDMLNAMARGDPQAAADVLSQMSASEAADALGTMDAEAAAAALANMDEAAALAALSQMDADKKGKMLSQMANGDPAAAASLLQAMSADDAAEALASMEAGAASAALAKMDQSAQLAALDKMDDAQKGAVLGALAAGDPAAAASILSSMSAESAAGALANMDASAAAGALGKMDAAAAASVLGKMEAAQQGAVLSELAKGDPAAAANLLGAMSADSAAAALNNMDSGAAAAALAKMDTKAAASALKAMDGTQQAKALSAMISGDPKAAAKLLASMSDEEALSVLKNLADTDPEALSALLKTMSDKDAAALLAKMDPKDLGYALMKMSKEERLKYMSLLEPDYAAKVLKSLPTEDAADILDELDDKYLKGIIVEMGEEGANILRAMRQDKLSKAICAMDVKDIPAALSWARPTDAAAIFMQLSDEKAKHVFMGMQPKALADMLARLSDEDLELVLQGANAAELSSVLCSLPSPEQQDRILKMLENDTRERVITTAEPTALSEVLGKVTSETLEVTLAGLSDEAAKNLLNSMDPNQQARVLAGVSPSLRRRYIEMLDEEQREKLLSVFNPDSRHFGEGETEPTIEINTDAFTPRTKKLQAGGFAPKNARLANAMIKYADAKPRSKEWLLGMMEKLYKEKIQRLANNAGASALTMPEFMFVALKAQYGAEKIVDQYSAEVVATLKKYQKDEKRIENFARFLSEEWDMHILHKYLKALQMCSEPVGFPHVAYDQKPPHLKDPFICMYKMPWIARQVIGFRQEDAEQSFVARCMKLTEKAADPDWKLFLAAGGKSNQELGKLKRANFLSELCGELHFLSTCKEEHVNRIFREYDINRNGKIGLSEVEHLVRDCAPEGTSPQEIRDSAAAIIEIGIVHDEMEGIVLPREEDDEPEVTVHGLQAGIKDFNVQGITNHIDSWLVFKSPPAPTPDNVVMQKWRDQLLVLMAKRHWKVYEDSIETLVSSSQSAESLLRSEMTKFRQMLDRDTGNGIGILKMYVRIIQDTCAAPFLNLLTELESPHMLPDSLDSVVEHVEDCLRLFETSLRVLYGNGCLLVGDTYEDKQRIRPGASVVGSASKAIEAYHHITKDLRNYLLRSMVKVWLRYKKEDGGILNPKFSVASATQDMLAKREALISPEPSRKLQKSGSKGSISPEGSEAQGGGEGGAE